MHNHVEEAELPGLRYLVRIRLVAFQDWNTPPVSPQGGGLDGGLMRMTAQMIATSVAATRAWMVAVVVRRVVCFWMTTTLAVVRMMMMTQAIVTITATIRASTLWLLWTLCWSYLARWCSLGLWPTRFHVAQLLWVVFWWRMLVRQRSQGFVMMTFPSSVAGLSAQMHQVFLGGCSMRTTLFLLVWATLRPRSFWSPMSGPITWQVRP